MFFQINDSYNCWSLYSCEGDGMVSSSRSSFQELLKQQSNLDVFF